jgi:predicted phosphodiesterase
MVVNARVHAWSDLHLDYPENRARLAGLSRTAHRADTLLLGGDLTHDLGLLESAFAIAVERFASVFFVPGNHELWLHREEAADSLAKLELVLDLCARRGVHTKPERVAAGLATVWIVPLLSWYEKPEEGPDSLFTDKPGEDPTLSMWLDDRLVRWPDLRPARTAAEAMLRRNEEHVRRHDAPVVSFSHFLPRRDLMFPSDAERAANRARVMDRNPAFNFSRVAGTSALDRQIRALGSSVHVYGHQHRNRVRTIDGVRYVSHCLGYPRELGAVHAADAALPRQVWPIEEDA